MIDEKKLSKDICHYLFERLSNTSIFKLSRKRIEQVTKVRNDIIDIINEQPQADKWIPVEERLPSEEEAWMHKDETGYTEPNYFIVQVKGAELPSVAYCIDGTFEPCDYDKRFADEIIAWQPLPLPQPYKKEGAEHD